MLVWAEHIRLIRQHMILYSWALNQVCLTQSSMCSHPMTPTISHSLLSPSSLVTSIFLSSPYGKT